MCVTHAIHWPDSIMTGAGHECTDAPLSSFPNNCMIAQGVANLALPSLGGCTLHPYDQGKGDLLEVSVAFLAAAKD